MKKNDYKDAFLEKIRAELSIRDKKLIASSKGVTLRNVNYVLNNQIEDLHDIIPAAALAIAKQKQRAKELADMIK